jgi:hypothetical protein
VTELLRYDEDKAFTLMDDAATVSRIVRTRAVARLQDARFGDWSAIELIGHVTDVAEVFAERIRRALEEDTPTLQSIPEGTLGDARREPIDLSKRLLTAHQRIVHLMRTPGAAKRPAIHSDWGRVNAGHLAAYQADHSHAHVTELAAAFPPTA